MSYASKEVATVIAENGRRRVPHSRLVFPAEATVLPEDPTQISTYNLYFQKLESMTYIFQMPLIVWV